MTIFEFTNMFESHIKCKDFLLKNKFIFCLKHSNSKMYIRRNGVVCCSVCKSNLTVAQNSILYNTKLSYEKWFYIFYEFWKSKNGLTSIKTTISIGVTKKVAWNMLHSIREKIYQNQITNFDKFIGITEMDEAYFSYQTVKPNPNNPRGRGSKGKVKVLGFVNRDTKKVRFSLDNINKLSLIVDKIKIVCDVNQTHLMTDSYKMYWKLGKYVFKHSMINHLNGEFAKGEIYTQSIENFWKHVRRLFKTHIRTSLQYIHLYIAEVAYKINNTTPFLEFLKEIL